jgi:hypothetical protein
MIERARPKNRRESEKESAIEEKEDPLFSRCKKEMVIQKEKRRHETRKMPFGL